MFSNPSCPRTAELPLATICWRLDGLSKQWVATETGTVLTLYRPFVFDVNDYARAYARRDLLNFLPLADWTRSEFQNDPDCHWDRLTFPPTV